MCYIEYTLTKRYHINTKNINYNMNIFNKINTETIIIILCTVPNNKVLASKLIKILLKNKLAACITLIDKAHSYYYWNNKLKNNTELQLLIKTKQSLEQLVFDEIKKQHPYQVPELLTLPIINGELNYLKWINSISD